MKRTDVLQRGRVLLIVLTVFVLLAIFVLIRFAHLSHKKIDDTNLGRAESVHLCGARTELNFFLDGQESPYRTISQGSVSLLGCVARIFYVPQFGDRKSREVVTILFDSDLDGHWDEKIVVEGGIAFRPATPDRWYQYFTDGENGWIAAMPSEPSSTFLRVAFGDPNTEERSGVKSEVP